MSKASRRHRKAKKLAATQAQMKHSVCDQCQRSLVVDLEHIMDGVAGCINRTCQYFGKPVLTKEPGIFRSKIKETPRILKKHKRQEVVPPMDEAKGISGLHEYRRKA